MKKREKIRHIVLSAVLVGAIWLHTWLKEKHFV